MMLHKNPSRRAALLKYGLSAPLFAAMLVLTSATVSEQKTIKIISDKMSSDAPVKEVAKEIGSQTIVLPKPPASFSQYNFGYFRFERKSGKHKRRTFSWC